MAEDRNDGLSREEEKAFRSLRETQPQFHGNEERIVSALKERGLIRPSSHRGRHGFIQIAAVAAVLAGTFFVGVEYGRRSSVPVEPVMTPTTREDIVPGEEIIERESVKDPSVLDEYRDEPDRPGNGKVLLAGYRNS